MLPDFDTGGPEQSGRIFVLGDCLAMGGLTTFGVRTMRLAACAAAVCVVLSAGSARAQTFTWTGATGAYNLNTNWAPTSGPPVSAGQFAVFGNAGTLSIFTTAAIAPDSWTFNTNTLAFSLSGLNVDFNGAGIVNNANTGQTISISNNLGENTGAQIIQQGNSTLNLSGFNTYSGGTTISAGTVAVFNNNSVGSGAVALSGGTFLDNSGGGGLTFANAFKVNTAGGTIDNGGDTLTLNGIISNGNSTTGRLTLQGGGLTILSGANSYGGGTTITGTGVQVQSNTVLGSGLVTLDGAGLQAGAAGLTLANNFFVTANTGTIDSNGFNLTLSGNISGPGQMIFQDNSFGGGGKTILTGTNTYTGGTLICSCATVQLGALSTKGSLVGEIVNEGIFSIVNADTSGITKITNDGGLTVFINSTTASSASVINQNGGEINFGISGGTDKASAGNAKITNDGSTIVFYASSTAGNASIKNLGGIIFFDNSSSAGNANITNLPNFGGAVIVFLANSSAGSATIKNALGTVTEFVDFASAGNATIITGGLFSGTNFFNNSTAGNATIVTNEGAVTTFADNSTAGSATIITNALGETAFVNNATGGNAAFITNGTGIVDFGGSLGPNGDGKITAGSIAGSGKYYIGGGNTLIVGSNSLSTEVSGVIADFNPCGCGSPGKGSLVKVGSGNLILSGINTYTGSTTVNGGILSVNGSIAASSGVTVNPGSQLGGTGIVSSLTINGGTLAPGNSIGTLTINGSLAITAASTYLVEVSSTAADRTNVTGMASLAGTVSAVVLGAPNFGKVYTILSANGGRSGTFGTVSSSNSLVIAASSYTATDVLLSLSPNIVPFATTINRRGVAAGLQNGLTGRDSGAFGALFTIPIGAVPAALTQLTGELGTGLSNASLLDIEQFLQLMLDPFVNGRNAGVIGGPALSFAPERNADSEAFSQLLALDRMATKAPKLDAYAPRWTVWGGAYGASGTLRGDASVISSHDITARNAGFAAGVDYLLSPNTIAGFALTGSGVSYSLAGGLGSGTGDTIKGGVYASQRLGNAFISASLAVGRTDARIDRFAAVGATIDHLTASPSGTSIGGRLEAGYRVGNYFGVGFIPYAALQAQTFRTNAYSETDAAGLNAFALNYNASTQSQVRSELGSRFDFGAMMLGAATLSWRTRVAWAHDYSSAPSIGAAFQALPGSSFAVIGAQRARDAALLSIGPDLTWGKGWSLRAKFDGEFAGSSQLYGGTGTLRYSW